MLEQIAIRTELNPGASRLGDLVQESTLGYLLQVVGSDYAPRPRAVSALYRHATLANLARWQWNVQSSVKQAS